MRNNFCSDKYSWNIFWEQVLKGDMEEAVLQDSWNIAQREPPSMVYIFYYYMIIVTLFL